MGVKAVLVALVGIWCWHLNGASWAGVLLYEPFAYPTGQQLSLTGTGDPLTLPSPTTTQWDGGLGFATGSEWGIGRPDTNTSITTGIAPALRFDNLWPEGGSIQIQHTSTTYGVGTLSRGIGVTYESGILWASYLYQAISVGGPSIVDIRFTRGEENRFTSANRRFRNLADASDVASPGGVGGGDTYTTASGPNLNDGRVYLLIAKFENVNLIGPAKWWALTQENYAAVLAMGLSEAALDAHCVDKLEVTNQASKNLTSGITWLQPVVFLGNAVVDQLRYGTSLADVASPAPVRWINLYRENFPNNNPSNQPIGTVGWSGYINAVDVTNTYVEGQTRMGVSNLSGSPEGIGYGFGVPVGVSPLFFAFTREFAPIDPKDYQQLWFSWRQHASGENAVFRLVIEITDQNQQTYWFASDMAFTNTGPLQTGAGSEFPSEAVLRGMLFSQEGSL